MHEMLEISNSFVNLSERKLDNNVQMSLQDRIIELFEEFPDKKKSQLARFLGVSRTTPTDWTSGKTKNINGEHAYKVAEFFGGIEPYWVQTGKGRKYSIDSDKSASNLTFPDRIFGRNDYDSNGEEGPGLGRFRKVPVVGTAQLGDDGYWSEIEYPVGFGDGYIEYPTSDPNAYAIRCKGDSMKPRIRDGEFVIVEPNSEAFPGDDVLVKAKDGRVMVKTFLYIRDNRVHLMSINEAHPPQSIALEDIEKMHPVVATARKAAWVRT